MQTSTGQWGGSDWDLRTRLSAVRDTLRPAEQRVAQFLLEQGDRYDDFTLAELAEYAGSSPSAVVHMCQTIGLSGFREFRLLWVQEAAARSASHPTDSKVFGALISDLLSAEQLIGGALDSAADRIVRARKVFLFGSGGSGLVADLGAEGLAVVGRMAFTFASDERITSTYFDDETAVVVISHKGENVVLGEAMDRAKQAGSTTILITGRPKSLLSSLADVLLLTSPPSSTGQRLIGSEVRTVQLAVVHALVTAVGKRLDPKQADNRAFWKLQQAQEESL